MPGEDCGLHEIGETEELQTGIEGRIGRDEKTPQMLIGLPMPARADGGRAARNLQHCQQEARADRDDQALGLGRKGLRLVQIAHHGDATGGPDREGALF